MSSIRSLLLASTILSVVVAGAADLRALATPSHLILAQAAPNKDAEDHDKNGQKKPAEKPSAPQGPLKPAPQQGASPIPAQEPQKPERSKSEQPTTHPPREPQAPAAGHRSGEPTPVAPAPKKGEAPAAPSKPEERALPAPPKQSAPPAQRPAQAPSQAQPTPKNAPAEHAPKERPEPVPGRQGSPTQPSPPAAQQPAKPAPTAQQPQQPAPGKNGQTVPAIPPAVQNAPPAAATNSQSQLTPSPTVQRAAPSTNPAAVPPPTQAISKQQFMMPNGQAPTANISQLKQQRQEVREGGRVIIREPDRTIIEQGNRTIVRHNEVDRFAVDARNVHVDRQGTETITIVERPNGVRIINITDDRGNLIRRVRRDPSGREIIIIDNTFAGAQRDDVFIEVSSPILRIPRDRYIVEAGIANGGAIYDVFIAPPIERIDRRYTVEQVRYSEPLRARMPRVDLDVNFDTGSWQLTPDQVEKLAVVADGLNRAISRNPQEVFLIEGHTDAVGSDIDNLSLSDRRAESVAVALTEQFQVPAENLVTQGYGKQDLKIQTEGPERANRRVAIRRITPLIGQQATITPR